MLANLLQMGVKGNREKQRAEMPFWKSFCVLVPCISSEALLLVILVVKHYYFMLTASAYFIPRLTQTCCHSAYWFILCCMQNDLLVNFVPTCLGLQTVTAFQIYFDCIHTVWIKYYGKCSLSVDTLKANKLHETLE